MFLNVVACVDYLPETLPPYNESEDLLIFTIHGAKLVARYREDLMGVGGWWPIGGTLPYMTKDIILWSSLKEFGRELE